jgi:sugar-specific transcriptional regulator TrmB
LTLTIEVKAQITKILSDFGLTATQARAYAALCQLGASNVKAISKESEIARQDIYRILTELEEMGFVEKALAVPLVYEAVPLDDVIRALMEARAKKNQDIKKRTEKLLKRYNLESRIVTYRDSERSNQEFIIVPSKVAIIRRLKKALDDSRISICTATTTTRFSSAIVEFAESYEAALRRGVEIKICSRNHVAGKDALRIIRRLLDMPGFEVKYFDAPLPAVVNIFDNKEACITMTAAANLSDASALWSSNPCFVALAQSFFENKWNEAQLISKEQPCHW